MGNSRSVETDLHPGDYLSGGFFCMEVGLKGPNYTQVANYFIDEKMRETSATATKVFLAISRKTTGFHKETDAISYSQIMELTGITGRATITKAIKELLDLELIVALKKKGSLSLYSLNITSSKNELPTSSEFELHQFNNCTGTSSKFELTKETLKETRQKKDTRIKNLIDFFYEQYHLKTGRKADVTGMWGKNFQRLLRTNTEEDIKAVIRYFFSYNGRTQFGFSNFVARYDNLAPKAVNGTAKGPMIIVEEVPMEEAYR